MKIIYTSNTGHTKEYAELLGKECNLEVYDLKSAKKSVSGDEEVIYMGWLMGGNVSGYKKAATLFQNIKAVAAVGMGPENTQMDVIRVQNAINSEIPMFYLAGGVEYEKLHGLPKMMLGIIRKTVYNKIEMNKPHTETEEAMYKLFVRNESAVNKDNLSELIGFINK